MQGVVFSAKHRKTGAEVAIKRTHLGNSAAVACAFSEIEVLSYMDHPHVAKLIGAYQTASDIDLVMRKVDVGPLPPVAARLTGNLRTYITNLRPRPLERYLHHRSETKVTLTLLVASVASYRQGFHLIKYLIELDKEEADGRSEAEIKAEKLSLLHQLVDAVAHVHSRGVVYRDLKPANVMVSKAVPRQLTLIDFGRATHLERAERLNNQTPMGTSLFQAPEVEEKGSYGQQSDMWAVGVLIYLFVSGTMPFEHSVSGLYKVLKGEYKPFDETFSAEAKDMVSRLLVVDPDQRMNAAQVVQHSFFNKKGVVAAKRVMAKLPKNVSASTGCIAALDLHKTITERTSRLLADKLETEHLKTLKKWMEMSAEESISGWDDSVNSIGSWGAVAKFDGSSTSLDNMDANDNSIHNRDSHGRRLSKYGGNQRYDNKQSLEALYMEMRAVGEASVRHRGQHKASYSNDLRRVSEDGPKDREARDSVACISGIDVGDLEGSVRDVSISGRLQDDGSSSAPSIPAEDSMKTSLLGGPEGSVRGGIPAEDSMKTSLLGGSEGSVRGGMVRVSSMNRLEDGSRKKEKTFLSIAHIHGLCSFDELITACQSIGHEDIAEELEVVKTELRDMRVKSLIDAGLKQTSESNAVLDTMLFRYADLFQEVMTIKVTQERERDARMETTNGAERTDADAEKMNGAEGRDVDTAGMAPDKPLLN